MVVNKSPVAPRRLHFATPRSVCYLATTLQALTHYVTPLIYGRPGCYWLVASGTPVGWQRGCLAAGLVRSAVRLYYLGGCNALFVCARR